MRGLTGIRVELNRRAFMYSLTQAVNSEVLENQIGILSTLDFNADTHDEVNLIIFLEDIAPFVCIAYLTWISILNIKDKRVLKLDKLGDYKQTRNVTKAAIMIVLYVLFKNVENAI